MKSSLLALFLFVASSATAQTSDSTIINKDSVFVKVEVESEFPGGEKMWNLYVQKKVEKKIDQLVRNKPSNGTCEVQFIVDEKGKITNVEALTLKESLLAKIVVDMIRKGPDWVPAQINGQPVKAWRRQKVTFRPPEKD